MDYTEYISAELYVLIPILYVIGAFIKNSKVKDFYIPLILGGAGVLLAGLWIFSSHQVTDIRQLLAMIFATLTQGILCAAAGVYTDNIARQLKEAKNARTDKKDIDVGWCVQSARQSNLRNLMVFESLAETLTAFLSAGGVAGIFICGLLKRSLEKAKNDAEKRKNERNRMEILRLEGEEKIADLVLTVAKFIRGKADEKAIAEAEKEYTEYLKKSHDAQRKILSENLTE